MEPKERTNYHRLKWAPRVVDAFFVGVMTLIGVLAIIAASILFNGCANISPLKIDDSLDPSGARSVNYRRSLELKVNGAKGIGSLVVPRAPSYEIEAKAKFDMDFLLLETCGRRHPFEKEGDKFKYVFTPSQGIEDNRPCAVTITGVENGKNRRGMGLILFQDPGYTLPATLNCDGVIQSAGGVSGCQSGAGVFVQITLPSATVWDSGEDGAECAKLTAVAGKPNTFEFKMPRGDCRIRFLEKVGGRVHRTSVYGFDQILPEAAL